MFDLYIYLEDLANGVDLAELNPNLAPYSITYSLNSFMHNNQRGVNVPGDLSTFTNSDYHFCADYSTDEIQNKALEYFISSNSSK